MELIFLGHIIGDFYVQTDMLANKKKESNKYMLIHCLIYTFVLGIAFYILDRSFSETLKISGCIYISHFLIDAIKQKYGKKFIKQEYPIFLIDQTIHILTLFLTVYIARTYFDFQINNNLTADALNIKYHIIIAIAILICSKPASILVALVFKAIPQTTANGDQEKNTTTKTEDIKIGSWIGILEREIILILGLMGQFSAIGFVLTAKSLARFKQFEKQGFAEKYLVGTLLSSLIAIGCTALCALYKINCSE